MLPVLRSIFCLLFCSLLLGAADDAAIAKDLSARLRRSKLAADGVSFTVKDGVVNWQGQVAIPQRKGAATRMAKAAGAKAVRNQIRVGAIAHTKADPKTFPAPKQSPAPKKFTVKYRPRAH
ncbi:MAG: BON domain-containing protein [Bryobacter sp.]|nr:BON domain-containing protein [Bryobacter sp.]